MAETTTGYLIPCWVWELEVVLFLFYFQSLALGSKPSEIWNPILIALLKTKIMNDCIPIAIEYHLIFSCLKQATYRLICFSSQYASYCGLEGLIPHDEVQLFKFTVLSKKIIINWMQRVITGGTSKSNISIRIQWIETE